MIQELAIAECPVSFVTPESRQLVEIFMRSEFAGSPLFGPDLSRWPARMVDAAAVIQQERNREQNARQEAALDGDS